MVKSAETATRRPRAGKAGLRGVQAEDKPGPEPAISESVSCDSKGLRRHFRFGRPGPRLDGDAVKRRGTAAGPASDAIRQNTADRMDDGCSQPPDSPLTQSLSSPYVLVKVLHALKFGAASRGACVAVAASLSPSVQPRPEPSVDLVQIRDGR